MRKRATLFVSLFTEKKYLKEQFRRRIAWLSIFALVFSLFGYHFDGSNFSFASGGILKVTLQANKETVLIGETFTYTIKYSYSGVGGNSINAAITDLLPVELEHMGFEQSDDVKDVTLSKVGGRDQVVFNFEDLRTGTTGVLKLHARFKPGSTVNDTTATNQVNFKPTGGTGGGSEVDSNTVVTKAIVSSTPDWSVSKTKTSGNMPLVTDEVVYSITVNGNSIQGGQDLKNLTVVDTLPAAFTFVESTISDSGSRSGNKITWGAI